MSKEEEDDGAEAAAPRGDGVVPVFELLVLILSDDAAADMVVMLKGGVEVGGCQRLTGAEQRKCKVSRA